MIALVDTPIDVAAVLAEVEGEQQGGVVLFLGRVRDHSQGKRVTHLDYDAYLPMALSEMQALEVEARERLGAERVALVHRTGRLELGAIAVAVAVAAAHRPAAFEACRWLIDTLKQRVPIWKKEWFDDGAHWVSPTP
ncbi:MAG: molybdopterin synthase catalytic subunit 1 [Planctomycetota bacterium]|nr:MAG: molybdopterin synthase catalytic subunit 1 [Planctomycetota bacterium]